MLGISIFVLNSDFFSVCSKDFFYYVDYGLVYEIMVYFDNGDVFLGVKNDFIYFNLEFRF